MGFRFRVGLCSSVFVLGVFVFDTRKRIERDTETVMEKLLEYLQPKTLNKFSYVAVICWILSGGTLFGIFADTENSESRFDFRCRGAKSENIDFVRGKCFQIYDKTYNQFTIPVYGFVIVNFFLIGIVCVIYSQIVKSTVEQLLEPANPNGDAARQSPDQENPTRRPQRRKLFTAYCCQLSARLVLGILFIVLQTELLYPSNFPSNFNCYLTSEGNQPRNSSTTGQNSTTLHECHNQRATKKNFWMNVVLTLNVIFALLILIETICILSRARKGRNFMEDRQFLEDHLKSIRPQHESHHELEQQHGQQPRNEQEISQSVQDHEKQDERQARNSENEIPLMVQHPEQRDPQQARSENEKPALEYESEELQQTPLSLFIKSLKKTIVEETEKLPDLRSPFQSNPGEGKTKHPTLDQIYTNLVVIPDRAMYDFTGERQEQLKVYPQPGGKKLQLKRSEDIVDAEKRNNLIVGRPGIGKTLFATKFLRDWACGRLFSKTQDANMYFDVAFLVKFRKFNSIEDLNLRELLTRSEYSPTEPLNDEIWKYILANPDKVLLIFDGMDEFKDNSSIAKANTNPRCSVDKKMPLSALYDKLASGKLLNGAAILTTTRPTAVSSVAHLPDDKIRTFEILGFTSEKVEEYVEKFTEEDTQAGEKLKQHISSNINIFSLCYIPVNCFIICSCLFQMLKFYGGVSLPTKLTEIYKKAVKLFFYKHNEEFRDKTFTREDFESNDLLPEVEEQFKRLGKVAFNGIEEGKLIFARNEVQGLKDSALFHRLPDRQTGPFEHEEQFCFIHLTMQEFFAAMHITQNMNETELRKFVADHIGDGKWDLVLQFVAGLLGDGDKPSSEMFTDLLPEETKVYGGENSEDKQTCWPTMAKRHLAVNLYKCIYENSKLDSVVESKLVHINVNIVNFYNCGLTPADCLALVHMIKNVQQISRINLDSNNIGSLGCAEICKLLVNRNSELRWLYLSGNGITDEGAQHLSEALRNENCKLQVLNLRNNKISDTGAQHLSEALRNENCTLRMLNLRNNKISDKGAQHLSKALRNENCTLQVLDLSGNNISDTGAQHLSEALRNENCKLQVLDLRYNNISDTGAQHLSEALRNENCKLQVLDLSGNNISDTGAQHLSEALRDENCKLQVLDLFGNDITRAGKQHLREVINKTQSNCKVDLLYT